MQSERPGRPLIFLDAAVIVGIKIGELFVFIKRVRLEIQSGRVDVRRRDGHAVFDGAAADHGKHDRLAAIVDVYPVTRLERLCPVKRAKASRFCFPHGKAHRFAFGFYAAKKCLVPFAVSVRLPEDLVAERFLCMLRFIRQLFPQFLDFVVVHDSCLLL